MPDAQLDLKEHVDNMYRASASRVIQFWTSSETVTVGERYKTINGIAQDCVALGFPMSFTLCAMNHVKHRFSGLPDDEITKAVTTAYGL
jgi:hypothetical protein